MDYDNFDETSTFEHLLLMILYRNQTKSGIRKSNTQSSLLLGTTKTTLEVCTYHYK